MKYTHIRTIVIATTPEPASILLFGGAGAALALFKKYR